MAKKPRRRYPEPEDIGLWHHVAREVKPLRRKGRKAAAADAPPPAPKVEKEKAGPTPPRKTAARKTVPSPPSPARKASELAAGTVPGVDRRTATRLRRGQLEIEARVDLHGHTLEDARSRLFAFIGRALGRGLRCVLVITGKGLRGKGAGVIRSEFPRWLNDAALRPGIVAFTEAQPKDGGSGAFYVYLRRKRET